MQISVVWVNLLSVGELRFRAYSSVRIQPTPACRQNNRGGTTYVRRCINSKHVLPLRLTAQSKRGSRLSLTLQIPEDTGKHRSSDLLGDTIELVFLFQPCFDTLLNYNSLGLGHLRVKKETRCGSTASLLFLGRLLPKNNQRGAPKPIDTTDVIILPVVFCWHHFMLH